MTAKNKFFTIVKIARAFDRKHVKGRVLINDRKQGVDAPCKKGRARIAGL